MTKNAVSLFLLAGIFTLSAFAEEGAVPKGVPPLQHVWVIMMENHGYQQLLNNPDAPFINQLARSANTSNNYFAVAHPSLTNYLEVVGGSNFGVLNDHSPDWHNANCLPNIATGTTSFDTGAYPPVCPIAGTGTDADTPAIDYSNEASGPPGELNIDGTTAIARRTDISGKTIADQLVEAHGTWKSYQESLPVQGPDLVNYSDGFFTNLTNFSAYGITSNDVVQLYAVKHNPFVYFSSVQEGENPTNSMGNVADFDGASGLYADLRSGHVPTFSFIAPNQCNDQHGRGNAGNVCNYDPNNNGTQAGLNGALIYRGDVSVQRIVGAIKASQAWREGHNAIVVLWDENDYSVAPISNQVLLIVDTNYGEHGTHSNRFYTQYSLLRTLEAGFGLPCLNHACDNGVDVMSDLFARGD